MRSLVKFAAVMLAACTVGPDYEAPAAASPQAWSLTGDTLSREQADLRDWWRRLGDPVLDGLVQEAIAANLDLRLAVARLDEARALRAQVAGGQWPTIDARAGYQRSAASRNTDFGDFGVLRDADVVGVGLDAAWEIDLWGRVRRGIEASEADLAAVLAEGHHALVTVVAEVVGEYLELRNAQQRLAIAEKNVDLQQQTLGLVSARLRAGLGGERELAQAQANLAATRSRLPELRDRTRQAEHRLSVLLGKPPGSLPALLSGSGTIPVAPLDVAVGVPADMLRRRPDVRAAERRLAAATARIGQAEAELLPRLSLLGSIGLEAKNLPALTRPGSSVFSFGPALTWNLFDGGSRDAAVAAAEARAAQELIRWRLAVLAALAEVEDAMSGFVEQQVRSTTLAAAVDHAAQAQRLAQVEYTQGLTDFQVVLDAERDLAEREDELVQCRAAIAREFTSMFKALGGGWQHVVMPELGLPGG